MIPADPASVAAWNATREREARIYATNGAWGPIPEPFQGEFWTGYRYAVPTEVRGWEWSTTFGRWGAFVTFPDGWSGYTYPRTAPPAWAEKG